MHHNHSENAMTEIALALAMGFFSLMVLTLVSMGSGSSPDQVAVTARLSKPIESSQPEAISRISPNDLLVIYYDGRLLDRGLAPIKPDALDTSRRTVLALPPNIPLAEAMQTRGRFNSTDLIVTTLDERWLTTLKEIQP
jgi:hypothetical protein